MAKKDYSGYGGQLEAILREFVQHLKATFGGVLQYVGTTTELAGPPNGAIRDLDVVVVLKELNEGHISYAWTVINRLRAKHNLLLDTRIHSSDTLTDIPVINRYLLKRFLVDQFGQNPFLGVSETAESLKPECLKRISEQETHIVRLLPRVAGDPNQLKSIAQSVYDAIRAFLLLENHPIASKERACEYFCSTYPRFSEAKAIYAAYLDPGSVVEVASFIFDALALVKHLRHRALQYPLRREVVLVNTPSSITPHPRDDYLSYDHNMPLGLLCLASYLRAQNVAVSILDAYAENLGALSTVDRLLSDGYCPQVVGLNVSSPNVHIAHAIAASLKRIRDDVTIVCGGPHASLAPEHTLSTHDVDYAVVGEGEEALLRLVNEILEGHPILPATIPGVFSFNGDGLAGLRNTEPMDLAALPPPDFAFLPLERYFSVKRRLYIHTSRGCGFNCIYCSVPQTWGRAVRETPVDRLFAYLQQLDEMYAPCELQIVDDNFSHKKGRLIRQLCDLINNNNLRFTWKCQARADQLDSELVAAMAQSGCFEIDLGIESGDAEIQKYIRKNLNLKRTIEMVASIRHQGMVCKAFFMLGFPEETHTQIAETINFAIELKRSGLSDVAFFPVMPFPGTEISAVTGKVVFQGAIIDDVYTHERSFSAHRLRKYSAKPEISLNERFTPDELRLLGKFAYGRFELSTEVKDLKSEFDRFVQLEESALYGV